MHNLIYICWRDAMHEEAEQGGPVQQPELIELQEVGWLLAENDEAITIGMELEPGPEMEGRPTSQAGRWRLHIPKQNILECREVEWQRAFPKRSIR